MANCDSNKNINKTFIIEHLGTPTVSACTGVYTSKVLACSGDTFIELYSGITINGNTLVNNSLSANTIDASVVLSGGTNILDIINANDTFVTGGTFNNIDDSLSLLRNDGDSIIITGVTDFFTTGGTYSNNTNLITFDRNDQLSAFTVDLSTIDVNDTFVTGATLVNKELVLDRNDSLSAVTVDLSGLTSNTGAGLTYNTTTGKIDLGGVLEFNDSSNLSNNMYFIPSTGANIIRWGADSLGNLPVNSGGAPQYITRFDYVANQGEHKIFGLSGPANSGVNIGYYGSQTSTTRIRQYKDVSQITIQNTPGINSSYTFGESDGPQYWRRDIWQSHDSNEKTETIQTFDEFKWDVYNNIGGDNAASKTYLHIESERIIAGAVNSGGTKFGIFQFAPTHIQFLDGDFKGVGTFPTATYLGDLSKSNLIIENDSADSTFKDATSNKRGIKYIGFGETDTETGVGANYSTLVGTSLIPKRFLIDYVASTSANTFVTGTTFINNQLNIALNNGTSVGTTIDNLSGLTVDGNVLVNGDVNIIGSATTINSEQVLIKDNIITLNSNATGSTMPVLNSGFEVLRGSADTKSILWLENTDLWSVDDDLSVSGYVSGTTYYGDGSNLTGIDDTFVTGGTYSGSTIVLNRNDGNSVNVTGITSDSVYTSDGTLTGNRTVDLDSNNLTLTAGTVNFEFGGYWQGFTRWDSSGAVQIKSNGSGDPFKIYKKVDASNPNFVSGGNGGGHLGTDGNHWTVSEVYGGTSTRIEIDNTYIKQYHGSTLHHNNTLGGSGSGVQFFQGGISGSLGYFIIGGNTRIGTEKISLQEDTLVTKKLELSTTTDGFLMPRLTTAQKNAISSPDTNLMVFDTDNESIERYNGTIWVSQSNGYNLISVNDSNGIPTFYTDLQTAINATASKDTVYIHSDIQLTSSVTIPARSSLTIALNGHRIWGDTTLGDFYLFGMVNTNTERYLHINGGGVIETIGTATSGSGASPFRFLNVGPGPLYCYFNDTQVKSENAYPFYTNGFTLLDGGHYYSTNNGMSCKVSKLINAYVDTATRPTLGINVIDCTLISRSYGFFCDRSDSWIGNHISGPVTESGNYGLLFCYGSSTVVNNYLEQTNVAGRDALYVRGSDPRDGKITNNICINKGTGTGGNLVYGSCSDNYFYSALGTALSIGGNCKRVVKNICITDSTTSNALSSLADYTVGNTAICTDVSHTGAPIFVGGVTNEVFGNKAICYNPSTTNILLGSTGTIYLANNVMSSVGIGLDLNGNVNSMINTPDAFGNLKIG